MKKACSVILALCLLLLCFPTKSSAITRTKPTSVDQPLPTKFDEYRFISLAKENRRLDKFAGELQRRVGATSQILVYGRYQANVDARVGRIRNYLVKNLRVNAYRVTIEGQACRGEFKTELWIVPPGAVRPTHGEGGKLMRCKVESPKSANWVTGVINPSRAEQALAEDASIACFSR